MANQNHTREGIHTGLTLSKSDEKWSDMLNFRCSDNRTFVVPHKLRLLGTTAGSLHTVLHGIGGRNYAIGAGESYTFLGHDTTTFDQLWRTRVTRDASLDDMSENLKVRGSYLGTESLQIQVIVHHREPTTEPEAEFPPLPEFTPELNCGKEYKRALIRFFIKDADTLHPIPGASIKLLFGRETFGEYISSPEGRLNVNMPPGRYQYIVEATGFSKIVRAYFTVTAVDQDITVLLQSVQNLEPFNILGILSNPSLDGGFTPGSLDLSAYFGVPLTPALPPGVSHLTNWRLHSDECGWQYEYYLGDLDDNGYLLTTGITNYPPAPDGAYFDPATKSLVSYYIYPEGMYLQLGVRNLDNEAEMLWSARLPCIDGGDQTP